MADRGIPAGGMPRRAGTGDAAAIARVHVAAWRAAYRDVLPRTVFVRMSRNGVERWKSVLAREAVEPDRPQTYVIEDGSGVVVGVAVIGPAREQDDPVLGELWMLNVAPEAWGSGLAVDLHDHVVSQLRKSGYAEAVLWVLPENARARRFYEREGWRPDGATKVESIGGRAREELRYRRVISGGSSATAAGPAM